nr:MAG TPA: hypothetical protein [Bacteriophage sp.]
MLGPSAARVTVNVRFFVRGNLEGAAFFMLA